MDQTSLENDPVHSLRPTLPLNATDLVFVVNLKTVMKKNRNMPYITRS